MKTFLNIHQFNTGENSIKFSNRRYSDAVQVELVDAGQQMDELELDHVNILKIDTEGCEVEILESLGNRLKQVDFMIVEYHYEKDRRRIDEILGEYAIFGSKAAFLGLGTVKYIRSRLM